MAEVGGSIEEISLDGRPFAVPADQDTNRKLGGFENEVMSNGNGTARIIKTRVPWSITGLAVGTDDALGDQEFLQALSDRKEYFPVTVTFASGSVYNGTGIIVGELQFANQSSTSPFDLSGEGTMVKQA